MAEDTPIKIRWRCMCFVGPCKWQTLDDYEPDEYNTEFETEDIQENWDAKACTATCPTCHAEMSQKFDEPEIAINHT